MFVCDHSKDAAGLPREPPIIRRLDSPAVLVTDIFSNDGVCIPGYVFDGTSCIVDFSLLVRPSLLTPFCFY